MTAPTDVRGQGAAASNRGIHQLIKSGALILCEGSDDVRFLKALLVHLDLEAQVIHFGEAQGEAGSSTSSAKLSPSGGKDKLRAAILATSKTPGFRQVRRLAVLRDADDPARESALESIRGALSAAGLPTPEHSGGFSRNDRIQVGAFVISGTEGAGELEDLQLASIEDDPCRPCLDAYFQCLESQGAPRPRKLAKSKVEVWLASRRPSLVHRHDAPSKGVWPFDSPAFEALSTFLRQLLSDAWPGPATDNIRAHPLEIPEQTP